MRASGKSHLLAAVGSSAPNGVRVEHLSLFDLESGSDAARAGAVEAALNTALARVAWTDVVTGVRAGSRSLVMLDDAEELLPAADTKIHPLRVRLRAQLLSAIAASRAYTTGGNSPRVAWIAATAIPARTHASALALLGGRVTVHLGPTLAPAPRVRLMSGLLRRSGGVTPAHDASMAAAAEACHGMCASDLVTVARAAVEVAAVAESEASDGSGASPVSCLAAAAAAHRSALARQQRVIVRPPPTDAQLARLVGMNDAAAAGMRVLEEALRPSVRAAALRAGTAPPRGLLIVGRPGSGKSALALALARWALDSGLAAALVISSTDIVSPVLGASEAALARIFSQARALAPAVLVIDQMSTLAGAHSSSGSGGTFARLALALGGELDALSFPVSEGGTAAAGARALLHSLYTDKGPAAADPILSSMHEPFAMGVPLGVASVAAALGRAACDSCAACAPAAAAAAAEEILAGVAGAASAGAKSATTFFDDHVVSAQSHAVIVIGVAEAAEDVAAGMRRRGRFDRVLLTPALTPVHASSLLARRFADSPLADGEGADAALRRICGTGCGANESAATAVAVAAATAAAIAEAPALPAAWSQLLGGLATHACGACACSRSASFESTPTAALFLRLHETAAMRALRRAAREGTPLFEAAVCPTDAAAAAADCGIAPSR